MTCKASWALIRAKNHISIPIKLATAINTEYTSGNTGNTITEKPYNHH